MIIIVILVTLNGCCGLSMFVVQLFDCLFFFVLFFRWAGRGILRVLWFKCYGWLCQLSTFFVYWTRDEISNETCLKSHWIKAELFYWRGKPCSILSKKLGTLGLRIKAIGSFCSFSGNFSSNLLQQTSSEDSAPSVADLVKFWGLSFRAKIPWLGPYSVCFQ